MVLYQLPNCRMNCILNDISNCISNCIIKNIENFKTIFKIK